LARSRSIRGLGLWVGRTNRPPHGECSPQRPVKAGLQSPRGDRAGPSAGAFPMFGIGLACLRMISALLVVVQIPIADARPFVDRTQRLDRPMWPLPLIGREFVRAAGHVRARRQGGVAPWPGEEVFVDARRLVRFAQAAGHPVALPRQELRPAFRRLTADGSALIRLEVGLRIRLRWQLAPPEVAAVIDSAADLQVRVPTPLGCTTGGLLDSDSKIAAALLRSTTRSLHGPSWWLSPGDPLMLVHAHVAELPRLPKGSRRVDLRSLGLAPSHDVFLAWYPVAWNGRRVGVWLLRYTRRSDHHEVMRRLRVHLLRLHAERECLRQMLRLVSHELITVQRGRRESEALQYYLNGASRRLARVEAFGLPQQDLLQVAYGADALISEGERASLLFQLRGIRRNVLRKIANISAPPESNQVVPAITIERGRVYYHVDQRQMNDESISIGSIVGSQLGAVGHHAVIRGSVNAINTSGASDETKQLLRQVVSEVELLARDLPAADAENALGDVQSFVFEAARPAPRTNVLKAFGSTLVDVAKTAAAVGTPLIELIEQVIKLCS
jgi:hypothetical protein